MARRQRTTSNRVCVRVLHRIRTRPLRLRFCAGDQLQRDIQHLLSPPDPSTNHDIVWNLHHNGTAAWLSECNVFTEWKAAGSLLWVHGKRMFLCPTVHTLD